MLGATGSTPAGPPARLKRHNYRTGRQERHFDNDTETRLLTTRHWHCRDTVCFPLPWNYLVSLTNGPTQQEVDKPTAGGCKPAGGAGGGGPAAPSEPDPAACLSRRRSAEHKVHVGCRSIFKQIPDVMSFHLNTYYTRNLLTLRTFPNIPAMSLSHPARLRNNLNVLNVAIFSKTASLSSSVERQHRHSPHLAFGCSVSYSYVCFIPEQPHLPFPTAVGQWQKAGPLSSRMICLFISL